ncbi:hypothetical protein F4859DRAFT_526170 [Xylaria cf. heliscus]|nr:hypothetical protein F4859DRAFT_526170 [Xylaria cf. heliscus]
MDVRRASSGRAYAEHPRAVHPAIGALHHLDSRADGSAVNLAIRVHFFDVRQVGDIITKSKVIKSTIVTEAGISALATLPRARTGLPLERRSRQPKKRCSLKAEGKAKEFEQFPGNDGPINNDINDMDDTDNNEPGPSSPYELRLPIRSVERDEEDDLFCADNTFKLLVADIQRDHLLNLSGFAKIVYASFQSSLQFIHAFGESINETVYLPVGLLE